MLVAVREALNDVDGAASAAHEADKLARDLKIPHAALSRSSYSSCLNRGAGIARASSPAASIRLYSPAAGEVPKWS